VSYVFAGYVLAFLTLGGYTWRVLTRQRALVRALHPEDDAP
jgi:hypothetical protein